MSWPYQLVIISLHLIQFTPVRVCLFGVDIWKSRCGFDSNLDIRLNYVKKSKHQNILLNFKNPKKNIQI